MLRIYADFFFCGDEGRVALSVLREGRIET